MDYGDQGWGESDWDSPPDMSWQEEIEHAIEEASIPPLSDTSAFPDESAQANGFEEPAAPHPLVPPRSDGDSFQEWLDQALGIPDGDSRSDDSTPPSKDTFLGDCIPWNQRIPGLPSDSDILLLDILPVSLISVDDAGNLRIEPDSDSVAQRHPAEAEQVEHLVSWLNETGDAQEAIAHAICSGSARLEYLSRQYDDVLAEAGYDRSDPRVQQCDADVRALHGLIEHAQEVLAGLRQL